MTKQCFIVGLVAALGTASVLSQSFTTPAGFLSTSANSAAPYGLGFYANGRYQWIDGETRGSQRTLMGINLRASYESHTVRTAMGRSFSDVILTLAESDFTKAALTFSANYATTGQRVFRNRMVLPSYRGTHIQRPVPWNEIALPFANNFLYSGNRDLLLDFEMRGGALNNQLAWSNQDVHPYHLDAHQSTGAFVAPTQHPAKLNPCADSGGDPAATAWMHSFLTIYNKNAPRDEAGNLVLTMWAFGLAPRAPAIIALTNRGDANGVDIGARCNKLHLNFGGSSHSLLYTADASGIVFPSNPLTVRFQPTWSGHRLWIQAAWNDSRLRVLGLTSASDALLPVVDPGYWRANLSAPDVTAKAGTLVTQAWLYSPVILYTVK